MSTSQFYVSFTLWTPSDYRIEYERICTSAMEALYYFQAFNAQGDILNPRFTYYPAGKQLIDDCDWRDIDYRPSVAPVPLSFYQLEELVDSHTESVKWNDIH